MLSALALLVVVAVVGLVLLASLQPDTFQTSRTQRIDAPPEAIYPLIADLGRFNTWNPFLRHDPAIRLSYSGPASGVGAAHEWEGNANVGKGRVEIVEASPPRHIAMKLHMMKPMKALNDVVFTLEPAGAGTDVTWTMSGSCTLVSKTMGLFMSMDRMVGGEFERGLSDLKKLVER